MRPFLSILCGLAIAMAFPIAPVIAATGTIEGTVKDAKTKETLAGANVALKGTGMGASTDLNGKYKIVNVPTGTYTLRITYVGYNANETPATVVEDTKIKCDINLVNVGIEGETVVITGQASGQSQAINQQLSSNQIVSVVSAAKIQELPDANAAESVGRLPGVTVLRSGGEGNTVVIRGLEPKFNKITIDGVQMSTPNPGDRTTDLSAISSSMLDGIQVSKTVTADMDADVLGGTVNFSLREAKPQSSGVPAIQGLVQGGYNNLSNAHNQYNNYKLVLSAENRFFNDDLGAFAQIDVERKNLTSNELGATYTHHGASYVDYDINGLGLYHIPRDRQRYNGALVMDYRLPDGKIKFSNFVSTGSTNQISRYEFFDVANDGRLFQLSESYSTLTTLTNSLGIEQQVSIFKVDLKLSHSYAEVKSPDDWAVNFLQGSSGVGRFHFVANVDPQAVPTAATNDFTQAVTNGIVSSSSFSRERGLTASLDLSTSFDFGSLLNAEIKFGGKYRYQTRSYDYDLYNGGGLQFGDAAYVNDLIINYFQLPVARYKISFPYFMDPNFSYGKMFDGNYAMTAPGDYGKLAALMTMIKSHTQDISAFPGAAQVYGHNNFASTSNNYSGDEKQSAFYVMTVLNIGPDITMIPGVRYQKLETSYEGVRGLQNRLAFLDYIHYDTTVAQSHGYWFPDLSLRYRPLSWFDVRASFTKTLSYPDFNAIIPRIDVDGMNGIISWNNFSLVPQRSTNYDLTLSFYDNTIGLFTVGGFYKDIDDLIYASSFYVTGTQALKYFPPSYAAGTVPPNGVQVVNTYVNNPHQARVKGVELDWQTHFWYLPSPFSGLVFSVNYTRAFSEAIYPHEEIRKVGRNSVTFDTTFTDRLLDQPNELLNFSLGYDFADFSVRVSMLYHTDIFTGVDFWPQLRGHTAAYRRWDIAAKQKLPWWGLQVFGNLNNLTGANDLSVIQGGGVPLSEQQYGMTVEVGLRWDL